ncbi:MAG: TspO/MBR family protein [Opitutales bacterium]
MRKATGSAPPRRASLLFLGGSLLVTFLVAALAGVASAGAGDFYVELTQPPWAPPGWLFGPVWSVLYALMAVAAWLYWRQAGWEGGRWGLALYAVQLVLNGLWSWLFFEWREGAWAFVEIMLLWITLVATVAVFARRSWLAAGLLVPYLAWVTFAAALCHTIWQLNPELLGG